MAEQGSTPPRKMVGAVNVVHLPILGVKVQVRRPSMFSLVASGGLPGELTSLVWKIFGGKEASLKGVLEAGPEIKNFAMLVEKFVPHVLVNPKVLAPSNTGEVPASDCAVDEVDGILKGSISLIDIPDIDKNHLFLYGIGVIRSFDEQETLQEVVAADLESFRAERLRPDAGFTGEAVQPAAEPPSQPGPEQPAGA